MITCVFFYRIPVLKVMEKEIAMFEGIIRNESSFLNSSYFDSAYEAVDNFIPGLDGYWDVMILILMAVFLFGVACGMCLCRVRRKICYEVFRCVRRCIPARSSIIRGRNHGQHFFEMMNRYGFFF